MLPRYYSLERLSNAMNMAPPGRRSRRTEGASRGVFVRDLGGVVLPQGFHGLGVDRLSGIDHGLEVAEVLHVQVRRERVRQNCVLAATVGEVCGAPVGTMTQVPGPA